MTHTQSPGWWLDAERHRARLRALFPGTVVSLRRGRIRGEPASTAVLDCPARVLRQTGGDHPNTDFEFTDPDMALSHGCPRLYHDTCTSASGTWSLAPE